MAYGKARFAELGPHEQTQHNGRRSAVISIPGSASFRSS